MYLAKGKNRHCEIDDYTDGCIPGSGYSVEWNTEFRNNTIQGLIEEVAEYHYIGVEDILNEDGKLSVSVLEKQTHNGWSEPSSEDLERWKKGEQELYDVVYVYDIYKVI